MQSVPKVRRFLQVLAVAVLLGGIAAVVVGGFVEGRQEAEQEALREEPIKPPLRVTKRERGEPVITLDATARSAIGLQLATLPPAKYQDQVRAYGAVLDLTTLTTLNTNYIAAVSQLNTAQARLAASQPAFTRAQALYAKNIGNLVQVQSTEAALIADRAAVEAAQSQVRTLRATALQEWGPVIGNSMVVGGGLITRLIERNEFLLQITLPPGVHIENVPNNASVEVAGSSRRAEVRYISPATRADPRIQGISYFYAAGANSGVLPGMNVRAYLANGAPVDGVIVPPSANMPFAMVGGVLAVFATGGVLTLGSMVGFVTLFGITLRNSIMMISHYEHIVGVEGARWGPEAAVAGAGDRLAPILMTSIVTALGLLPLAIGMNEPGREIEGPMALVIVGGLATSMALNLLVLPTLALQFGKFGGTGDPDVAAPAEPVKLRSVAAP